MEKTQNPIKTAGKQVKKVLKTVKGVLFADPKLLYKEERHLVNQPYYFPGTNGKGVLLVHGWTSTPYEVRRLGKYLNENGYTAMGIQLKGHGTVPKDLENVKWTEWLEDIKKAYEELKTKCDKIYIAGTSIGSNLAVQFAIENPEKIAGLVLMAAPYKIRIEKIVIFFAKFFGLFSKYNKKVYLPTFGSASTITRLISYQTYPIKSALETFDLIKKTRIQYSKIFQPCFCIQSSSDHIVSKNSMEIIYNLIKSKIKQKKYVKRAYHTFISDIRNEHVFEDILNFINNN